MNSEYIRAVERVLRYIDKNLTHPISLEGIAGEANLSPFHFHRIFQAFTGFTPGEYIRRRRLTETAMRLLHTEDRIIDIAMEYGFQSQESFTRSFKKQFKITPARYRSQGQGRYLFERTMLTEEKLKHWHGGISMKPKIIEKGSFKVIGMQGDFTLENNTIPQLWEAFIPRMSEIKDRVEPEVAYGICGSSGPETSYMDFTEKTPFTELVCQEVSSFDNITEGMTTKTVPAGKYAVFTHKGILANLKHTYDYIYKNWLPDSGYKVAAPHDFELYDQRFNPMDQENSEIDIYIPIN